MLSCFDPETPGLPGYMGRYGKSFCVSRESTG
jgi:hypothetical protein